ncbi:g3488 [Coccomyxa elongata]
MTYLIVLGREARAEATHFLEGAGWFYSFHYYLSGLTFSIMPVTTSRERGEPWVLIHTTQSHRCISRYL